MHYNYNTHFAYYTYYPCAWDAQTIFTHPQHPWTLLGLTWHVWNATSKAIRSFLGGFGYVLIFLFLWYSLWSLLNPAWKLKENTIFFISVIMNLTLKSIVFYFSNGEEYNYIPYLLIKNTHSRLYTPFVLLVCLSVSSLASTFQDIMFFVSLDRNKSLSLFNLNNLTFKIKIKVKA